MKQIYNEGRVAGLNSYEVYVRQFLSTNPTGTPMTEREWLTATLSESCSMILRIPAGTLKGYHDYPLPEGTDLCGCSVIYGTMFEGEVSLTESGYWADEVISYGTLICNTPDLHPSTPGTGDYIPVNGDPSEISNEIADRCRNYIKISSGMMFQPGEWKSNVYYTPLLTQDEDEIDNQQGETLLAPVTDNDAYGTVIPDFAKVGFIRLGIVEDINSDVYILLHGFAYKTIVKGEVGYNMEEYSSRPQDGDFLGPSIFPWGCPIYLTVTTNVQYVLYQDLRS